MTSLLASIAAFFAAHPSLSMLLFPLGTFILTLCFKQYAAEDYAKLPAPLAAFLRFCASHSADAPAVLDFWARIFGKAGPAAVAVLFFCFGVCVSGATGCAWLSSPEAKIVEREVLNDAQIACVLANTLLPNEQAIAAACSIDQALTPIIADLISAHKTAALREAKAKTMQTLDEYCDTRDAGASDAGFGPRK